jgi:hypothetical protein
MNEFPKWLYHPDKPTGVMVENQDEADSLGSGWVSSPALFKPAETKPAVPTDEKPEPPADAEPTAEPPAEEKPEKQAKAAKSAKRSS